MYNKILTYKTGVTICPWNLNIDRVSLGENLSKSWLIVSPKTCHQTKQQRCYWRLWIIHVQLLVILQKLHAKQGHAILQQWIILVSIVFSWLSHQTILEILESNYMPTQINLWVFCAFWKYLLLLKIFSFLKSFIVENIWVRTLDRLYLLKPINLEKSFKSSNALRNYLERGKKTSSFYGQLELENGSVLCITAV